MNTHLFIGGPEDGNRIAVPNLGAVIFGENAQAQLYKRRVCVSGENKSVVYVHESIPENMLMKILIANYQPKPRCECGKPAAFLFPPTQRGLCESCYRQPGEIRMGWEEIPK